MLNSVEEQKQGSEQVLQAIGQEQILLFSMFSWKMEKHAEK